MPHVTVGAENGAVILPYRATAARLPRLIREVKLVTVEGGPHDIAAPPRRSHRPAGVPHQPARRHLSAVAGQS